MMKKIIFISLSITLLFISCTNKSQKFVGTWTNILPRENGWNVRNQEIIIEKVGENFTVQASDWNDGARTKMPASYNKDLDKLVITYGIATTDILYDPKSKHILVSGEEYQK